MWTSAWNLFAIVGAFASTAALIIAIAHLLQRRRWTKQPTWDDSLRVAERLLETIEGGSWRPNVVVGLGRSGGIWGGWLAGNLGALPLAVIDLEYKATESGRRVEFYGVEEVARYIRDRFGERSAVLLIEGAASTGMTFREFSARFVTQVAGWDLKRAVLYAHPAVDVAIDFVGRADLEPWPERFAWHQRVAYKPHLRNVFVSSRAKSIGLSSPAAG